MRKIFLGGALCVFAFTFSAQLQAAIIDTSVLTGMMIYYYANAEDNSSGTSTMDATATSSGVTSASVSISGTVTGATAYSTIDFAPLTDESATLNFDLGYNGNNYTFEYGGYMGGILNEATINYHASSDTSFNLGWDFAYIGSNPFGLQIINLHIHDKTANVSQWLNIGNTGYVGSFTGSDVFNFMSAHDYTIGVKFQPNIAGEVLGLYNGSLAGDITFDFNGSHTPVPEPATMLLFGTGLAGLAAARRRKKKAC